MASERLSVVLVDDDALVLQSLKAVLSSKYEVHAFGNANDARNVMEKAAIAVAILDLNIGDQSGLDVLKVWRERYPDTEILFCSGESRVDRAIECLRQGASDFIVKPFGTADLLLIVARAAEKYRLKKRVERLSPLVQPRPVQFIAQSPKMNEVVEKVRLLKHQTHLNVLILGESGTGKEIVSRLLHQQEEVVERPFVVVNTPAIPASLMEAELFGVEKGAYTDAKAARPGKFELADGGDIFLDEIGDLPMDTQAKMLRTLQERQIERVGSNRTQQVSFRVISATNQPLADLMSNGRFREDLMYRLSDLVLWLPPLREHREDIPSLAQHFLHKYCTRLPLPKISDSAMETLMTYHWPGNIRQMESTIKRALIFNRGEDINKIEIYDPTMFNPMSGAKKEPTLSNPDGSPLENQVEKFERQLIESAIAKHGGNKQAAMEELQVPRATFYRKIAQLGISLT